MDLKLQNIRVRRAEKNILDDICLTIQDGEFLSLLGASGAGKSTLLKVVAGILYQDTGTVSFDEMCIDELPTHKRRCAMVFQDIRLFPNMNVRDNVAYPYKMARVSRKERHLLADEMLCHVGLEGFGDRHPGELSGGQAQRVALARALASNPQALLLDEPFSGLDEQLRDDMRSLVLRLHRAFNMTTIMVTHDTSEALMMSDRIAYLSTGKLVQVGTPEELYLHPLTAEIAQSYGGCSTLHGIVSNDVFTRGNLTLPAPGIIDGSACAIVRNQAVTLQLDDAGPLQVRCGVFCSAGHLARIDIEDETLIVPVKSQIPPGTKVRVDIDPQGCFVYPDKS